MNEQQTIRFILENSSEPVIKNPVMRAALEEPRTMAQELRNMYAGGQLVQNTADGSRPGYATSTVKKGKFKHEITNQHGTFYSDKNNVFY